METFFLSCRKVTGVFLSSFFVYLNIIQRLTETTGLDQLSPHLASNRDDPWQMEIDTPHRPSHDLLLPSSETLQRGHSTKLLALVKNLRSEGPGVKRCADSSRCKYTSNRLIALSSPVGKQHLIS
jgi:hypothetical protein